MNKIKRILHLLLDPWINLINSFRCNILYLYKYISLKPGLNTTEIRNPKIIISLTSFPERIKSCSIVISYLLSQTVKPDRIILYLAEDQFPEHKLPLLLKKEIKLGVKVEFTENLRSHKKYFYSMQQYPDDIIITVDDDFVYQKDLIENLINGYAKNPRCITAMHTSEISFNDNKIDLYENWNSVDTILVPSKKYVAIGVGGVLYPPHLLHKELFSKEFIIENCFNADDLWLKTMEVMNNIPVQKAGFIKMKYVPSSQKIALYKTNVNIKKEDTQTLSNNDIQFNNILSKYNSYFGENDTLISRIIN